MFSHRLGHTATKEDYSIIGLIGTIQIVPCPQEREQAAGGVAGQHQVPRRQAPHGQARVLLPRQGIDK